MKVRRSYSNYITTRKLCKPSMHRSTKSQRFLEHSPQHSKQFQPRHRRHPCRHRRAERHDHTFAILRHARRRRCLRDLGIDDRVFGFDHRQRFRHRGRSQPEPRHRQDQSGTDAGCGRHRRHGVVNQIRLSSKTSSTNGWP